MNINKAFPSKYLKASDLDEPQIVEVERVEFEEVGQNKERRPVAYFKGIPKGVVLNKTRSGGIVKASGSEDTDDWPGTMVQLYPSTTQFQGEEVECIGIRPPKAKARKTPVDVEHVQHQDEMNARQGGKDDDSTPF